MHRFPAAPGRALLCTALAALSMACSGSRTDTAGADVETQHGQLTPATDLTISRCKPGGPCALTVALPKGLALDAARFVATGGITLADRARVVDSANKPTTIANAGAPEVNLGVESKSGDVWSVPRVTLRDRARVEGVVRSPAGVTQPPGTGSVVTGGVVTDVTLAPVEVRSWMVAMPSTFQTGFTLQSDKTATLAPGAYDTMTVHPRSTLTLTSGTYYVKTFDVEPDAKLRLNQAGGPVLIYVSNSIIHRGSVITTTSALPNLLIGYLGTSTFNVEGPLHATVIAPNALVSLRATGTKKYSGAYYAKQLDAQPDVVVTLYPSLLPTLPPASRTDCATKVQPNPSLPEPKRSIQAHLDMLTLCAAPGIPDCAAKMTAVANADRRLAAQQYLAKTIGTAQHLAIVRDRTRKLHRARKDPAIEAAYCNGTDGDNDLVPSPQDQCPNTPPLTPTDDRGCTVTTTPQAPPRDLVDGLLQRKGILYDKKCEGAPAPNAPIPFAVCQVTWGSPVGKVIGVKPPTNQPAGCPVWYEFQVSAGEVQGAPGPRQTFFLAHPQTDTLNPSPPIVGQSQGILIRQLFGEPGDRGLWASLAPFGRDVTVLARATNGNGVPSAWTSFSTVLNPCLPVPPEPQP